MTDRGGTWTTSPSPDAPDRLRAILQAPRDQALQLQLDLLALVERHLPIAPGLRQGR
ncbi:hypothetical protein ABZV14_38890 [Streptosporangium canum]|uniref:hypothetical protein n=1 Tax=Streptosporangium canum TaxID=324952 RepID=UPI0033AF729E